MRTISADVRIVSNLKVAEMEKPLENIFRSVWPSRSRSCDFRTRRFSFSVWPTRET